MSVNFKHRLEALGAELPPAAKPGSPFFLQAAVMGNLVFMSGQIPRRGDEIMFKGRLGDTLSNEDGYKAARLCALNLLVQLNEALDLGLSEMLDDGSVTLIEWGDTITRALPRDYLEVRITFGEGDEERLIELTPVGTSWQARMRAVAIALGPWSVDDERTG